MDAWTIGTILVWRIFVKMEGWDFLPTIITALLLQHCRACTRSITGNWKGSNTNQQCCGARKLLGSQSNSGTVEIITRSITFACINILAMHDGICCQVNEGID